MATNALFFMLFIITVYSRQQLWVEYSYGQNDIFQKFYHRVRQGYFVDLGGFNPIAYSNTVKLSNWKGLILQANQPRAENCRDFEPNIQTLNFAVSNVTVGYTTFYQTDQSVAASLSAEAVMGKPYREEKVMTISIVDLCHKYYKVRPKLMNIDVEGIGESVLKANDWATEKCVPELIFAEDFDPNIKAGQGNIAQYLTSINYTMFEKADINKVFIHNSVLEEYKKEVKANAVYVSDHQTVPWNILSKSFQKLLGRPFDPVYIPSTHPAYVHIRQPSVINIVEINKHSNMISKVGLNRPILLFEYDRELSSIYLGAVKYTVEQVNVDDYEFILITSQMEGKQLKIYVFNHYKYRDFELVILQPAQNTSINYGSLYQSIAQNLHYLVISTIVLTNIFFLIVCFVVKRHLAIRFRAKHLQHSSVDSPGSISDMK